MYVKGGLRIEVWTYSLSFCFELGLFSISLVRGSLELNVQLYLLHLMAAIDFVE